MSLAKDLQPGDRIRYVTGVFKGQFRTVERVGALPDELIYWVGEGSEYAEYVNQHAILDNQIVDGLFPKRIGDTAVVDGVKYVALLAWVREKS